MNIGSCCIAIESKRAVQAANAAGHANSLQSVESESESENENELWRSEVWRMGRRAKKQKRRGSPLEER